MNNRGRGGGQAGGRALAGDGTPSKDGAYADEATGFLQDVEAAETSALQGGLADPPAGGGGGGSSTARPWKCGDLWWLLALPAAVMLLLFVREWRNGFGGTTAVIAKVTQGRLSSFTATPSPDFASSLDSGGGSSPTDFRPDPPKMDRPALAPADAAVEAAVDQLEGGTRAAQEADPPQQEPQQPDGKPAGGQQQGSADQQQEDQQGSRVEDPGPSPGAALPAPSGTASAPGSSGTPAEVPVSASAAAAAAPEPGAPAGQEDGAAPDSSDSAAAGPNAGSSSDSSSGSSRGTRAGGSSDAAGPAAPQQPGDAGPATVAAAPRPGPTPGPRARTTAAAKKKKTAATGAAAAAAKKKTPAAAGLRPSAKTAKGEKGSGAAAAAPGGKRQRRVPRVVVLPSQDCQAVMDPTAEAQCMANGASTPACKGRLTKGQYKNSYLTPFVRIAPQMAKAGVANYVVNKVRPQWSRPGDGSSWDKGIAAADILIVEELMTQGIMRAYPNKTYVVLQANAAAAMLTCAPEGWCAQHLLEMPQVGRFLQHTGLKPIELNNAQRYLALPHYHLMQQVHLDSIPEAEAHWGPAPGQPAFTSDMLAKAQTLNPMFWRWRYPFTCHGQPEWVQLMAPSLQPEKDGRLPAFLPPMADRPIDVTFSGSVNPPKWRQTPDQKDQNVVYAAHRQALLDELAAIQTRNPGMRVQVASHISYPEYVDLLRSTKIFISPLGHGEYSGKDYETVISRALLVKPLARHLESYPNIYEANVTCAEVAMDFSDLEAVLKGLLADPPHMQRLADAAYGRLVEFSDPARVAADVADMLHAVAAEAGLGDPSGS